MNKVEIAGQNIKEIALIMLVGVTTFVVGVVGVSIAIAIRADPSKIQFSGTIDLGQFVGVVIGIAMVAIVFVGQQLTARQTQTAAAQTDNAWLADKEKTP